MTLDVLAFGAHADDVEITCGGTIIKLGAQGYQTGVIALTRGELGTRGSAEIRQMEFEAAGKIMGLAIHKMLDIPDGNVEVNWQNKLKVIQEIRAYKPKIIFAPYWIERHPDHANTSNLVREAAFLSGLQKIDTGQEAYRPIRIIYYASRYEFKPSFIVDITDNHEQKLSAIKAYRSQFMSEEKDELGTITYISRQEFFDSLITRARQYGNYIGVKFGEPFLVKEALRIDDPVSFFGLEYRMSIP